MKTPVADEVQAYVMDMHTAVGSLCHAEGDQLRCVACGHRCLIGDDRRGICKVRFNRGGQLYVPWGYIAGLQSDPVEKKPFFHVYPGSDALTFGMLGCDLHCSYCFPGDTVVLTDRGPLSLEEAFTSADRVRSAPDAEIAYPDSLRAVSASGTPRPVRAVFKHHYRGPLVVIDPYYLPSIRCTPDHRIYATADPTLPPKPIPAGRLTERHYLAVPRRYDGFADQVIDVARELASYRTTYRVTWDLSPEERNYVTAATAAGKTSRAIGAVLGKDASYVRHVRCRLARGRGGDDRTASTVLEADRLRFPHERRPGVPALVPLDASFARLLGLYCAEGCVVTSKKRPNSHTLNFSFSHAEGRLVDEVIGLLDRCLGLRAHRVERHTTLAVAVSKASAALLFKSLAGGKSQ